MLRRGNAVAGMRRAGSMTRKVYPESPGGKTAKPMPMRTRKRTIKS